MIDGYYRSKLMAEKAAWDYWKTLPEEDRFELVTILPGLILGPAIFPNENFSGTVVKMIMMGMLPALPNIRLPVVDVRDVVYAHI